MNDMYIYGFAAIAICSAVTILIRSLPFVVFGNRKLPRSISYLGQALPGAVMVILVIFCLRNTDTDVFPYGIPEAVSLIICVLMHKRYGNTILSIASSTAVYMILTRIM